MNRPVTVCAVNATARLSSVQRHRIESLFLPAAKAYLLGYLMDILPALVKALVKFGLSEVKRIRNEKKRRLEENDIALEASQDGSTSLLPLDAKLSSWSLVAPSLAKLPILFKAIVKLLITALGKQGMAISCFWAMAGWRISESLVWWPVAKYYAHKLSSGTTEIQRAETFYKARVSASFIAAAISSFVAMMALQRNGIEANDAEACLTNDDSCNGRTLLSGTRSTIDTNGSWIPQSLQTPRFGFTHRIPKIASLAPAGHFLSRLTNLTMPATPTLARTPALISPNATLPQSPTDTRNSLSSSEPNTQFMMKTPDPRSLQRPSPTIDLTLFALVRGIDTVVRAAPLLLGGSWMPSSSSSSSSSSLSSLKPSKSAVKVASLPTKATRANQSMLLTAAKAFSSQAESFVFVICCAQIMWAWFYHPERLPPTYVKWIMNLATMDERLLLALRSMRYGKPVVWRYDGQGVSPAGIELLGSLSEQLGYPYQWGDPTQLPNTAAEAKQMLQQARKKNNNEAKLGPAGQQQVVIDPLRGGEPGFVLAGATGPRGRGEMGGMPCEIVHCGTGGASCYKNALYRWLRGWKMSMAIYFPVHLLPRLLFNPSGFFKTPVRNLVKAVLGAARSASFLATFIVGNWFPICLTRTVVLPRLFPSVPFLYWDSGLGPMLGSIFCGFSIFIEEKRKRAEMALYVAPRALFAIAESLKPGWLSQGKRTALLAERVVFGLAVGIVVATGRHRPDLLRGITATMGWVTRPPTTIKNRLPTPSSFARG